MGYHQRSMLSARGDPGFFSFVGKALGGAAKLAGGLLPGPAGGILRGVGGLLAGGAPRPPSVPMGLPTISGGGAVAFPGGALGFGGTVQPAARGAVAVGADGCPKGHQLNKSGYFLKSGAFIPPRSRCVRIRRANPANSRALRRALRREEGFVRLARRTGLVALPKSRRLRKAVHKK